MAAEEDYQAGNYAESLEHLETVKMMLGNTNEKVMYIEIINRDIKYKLETFFRNNPDKVKSKYFDPKSLIQVNIDVVKGIADNYEMYKDISGIDLKPRQFYLNQAIEYEELLEKVKVYTVEMFLEEFDSIEEKALIAEMSSYYIKNFAETVPLDKLNDIYKISKRYLEINLDK
ncbi:hypothetical protein [Nonlabens sp. Hel1_33_55]|uniref:hypothetical protein n=1 Tax=Nonlabens sp. Hel1_33_55 TaxID=1336802 RepID=UPI0012FD3205|nr:hypothetical protein [Nonlabens sp. Hel1_33_55]